MIKVTVQTEDRLQAITNLSAAIKAVAEALSVGTHVEISNNTFNGQGTAIKVDVAEVVNETIIKEE